MWKNFIEALNKIIQSVLDIFKKKNNTIAEDLNCFEADIVLVEELEKFFNTSKQDWPKVITVPTLLISVYPNWEYDSVGVDFSQFEEKGLVHYFCTSIKDIGEESSAIIKNGKLIDWGDGFWTWL